RRQLGELVGGRRARHQENVTVARSTVKTAPPADGPDRAGGGSDLLTGRSAICRIGAARFLASRAAPVTPKKRRGAGHPGRAVSSLARLMSLARFSARRLPSRRAPHLPSLSRGVSHE